MQQRQHILQAIGIVTSLAFIFATAICISFLTSTHEDNPCRMGNHEAPILCSDGGLLHASIVDTALPGAFFLATLLGLVFIGASFFIDHIFNFYAVKQHVQRGYSPPPISFLTYLFSQGILHSQTYS